MNTNIFQLLPKIGALKRKVHLFERELFKEFGVAIKLDIYDMDSLLGIDAIVKTVSNVLSVSMNKMLGNDRLTQVKEARQIAMFLCKKYIPEVTDKEIAGYFLKDRSNVIHSVNRVNALIDSRDESILACLVSCEEELNALIALDSGESVGLKTCNE